MESLQTIRAPRSATCGICHNCFSHRNRSAVTHPSAVDTVGGQRARHLFHKECIKQWLLVSPICPYDRVKLNLNSIISRRERVAIIFKTATFSAAIGLSAGVIGAAGSVAGGIIGTSVAVGLVMGLGAAIGPNTGILGMGFAAGAAATAATMGTVKVTAVGIGAMVGIAVAIVGLAAAEQEAERIRAVGIRALGEIARDERVQQGVFAGGLAAVVVTVFAPSIPLVLTTIAMVGGLTTALLSEMSL